MAADALDQKILTRSPENLDRATQAILRQTERLEVLVRRMIDSSEIASGHFVVDRQPVDLAAATRRVVARLRQRADQRGSALRLDASAPVWVRGDSHKLEQLVWDLIENAVTFGRGKPVDIAVLATEDTAVLSVRDYGPGIAPEQQKSIFDRFCRGGLSTRAFGGLGLGLYVGRGIAEAHGGQIGVESQLGAGATFTVQLRRLATNQCGVQ